MSDAKLTLTFWSFNYFWLFTLGLFLYNRINQSIFKIIGNLNIAP